MKSTNLIGISETKTIFISSHGFEGLNGPHFYDISCDLEKFIVIRNEIFISNKNFNYFTPVMNIIIIPIIYYDAEIPKNQGKSSVYKEYI
ncbi:hypothetical protein ACFLRZ_03905 [Bacteroidota bacterium]